MLSFRGQRRENGSAIKATVNSTKRQTGVFIPFLERSWHLHCLSYGNKYHDSFFIKYLRANGQQKEQKSSLLNTFTQSTSRHATSVSTINQGRKTMAQPQFKTPEEKRRYKYNLIFIHILCLISVMISDFPFL